MSIENASTPAGWYSQEVSPTGRRYWDGSTWTDQYIEHEPQRTIWAYKTVKWHNLAYDQFQEALQLLGLDGWELVSITNMEKSVLGGITGGSIVGVLKRQATNEDLLEVKRILRANVVRQRVSSRTARSACRCPG